MMIPLVFTILTAMPINVAIAVVLFGLGYGIFSLVLQRKLGNPKKTKEIQQRINNLTKEMNEMAKRNEDITQKQQELMPLLKESMMSQMKSMFVIFPVFLVIYYVLLPYAFSSYASDQVNFIVPLTYTSLFIVTAIVTGLVLSMFILFNDRRTMKKQQQIQMQDSTK